MMYVLAPLAPIEINRLQEMPLVHTMFKAFDVDCTDVEYDWPTILAECFDCWPQHLHNGTCALTQELVRPDLKSVLRNVFLTNVPNIEHAFRH